MSRQPQPAANGTVPAGEWQAHIGHKIHPHRHIPVERQLKPCSGRWYCEKDKAWFTGLKCHEG